MSKGRGEREDALTFVSSACFSSSNCTRAAISKAVTVEGLQGEGVREWSVARVRV